MSKPLTYRKPSGEWGIEGVDLSTLPPPVYGALAKLMRLAVSYTHLTLPTIVGV